MHLVSDLLRDIASYCVDLSYEILLTINIDEELFFYDSIDQRTFVQVIRNASPKGFGANHNQAFKVAKGEYFCVLNPDVRLQNNPFPALIAAILAHDLGLCAPMVVNPMGLLEDSARPFPSPFTLIAKAFGAHGVRYQMIIPMVYPDWVGGMFMLFPADVYRGLCGFDESYFLYYEDVDICGRLYLGQKKLGLLPSVSVVHMAQRASHRSRRYFWIHLRSIANYFFSVRYAKILWKKNVPKLSFFR